jgi:hypothetical protein
MYHEAGKGDAMRPTDKEAFDKGFEAIFGQARAKRGSYVFDQKTNKLVPKDEFYSAVDVNAPMVMADIQGYQSQVTGEWIGSRSLHRQHLKEHRLVEVGNELKAHTTQRAPQVDRTGIKRDLIDAVNRHWK